MTGEEAFEIAAAVAAISGLGSLLVLSLVTIVGVWRLFRLASDSSQAAARSSLGMEELSRKLADQANPALQHEEPGGVAELRQQAETIAAQQQNLQEMLRTLGEQKPEGGAQVALDDLQAVVGRLDATVGDMAASLANLIQLLERQQEGQ